MLPSRKRSLTPDHDITHLGCIESFNAILGKLRPILKRSSWSYAIILLEIAMTKVRAWWMSLISETPTNQQYRAIQGCPRSRRTVLRIMLSTLAQLHYSL